MPPLSTPHALCLSFIFLFPSINIRPRHVSPCHAIFRNARPADRAICSVIYILHLRRILKSRLAFTRANNAGGCSFDFFFFFYFWSLERERRWFYRFFFVLSFSQFSARTFVERISINPLMSSTDCEIVVRCSIFRMQNIFTEICHLLSLCCKAALIGYSAILTFVFDKLLV